MGRIAPTDTDKAYAAGFIDGEGSVQIEERQVRGRPGWRMNVSASQDDPRPLMWIQARWGGSIFPRRLRANGRRSYHWSIHTRDADLLLRDILPFLQVKRVAAEIGLEFRLGLRSVGRAGITASEVERRRDLKQRLHTVNRRINMRAADEAAFAMERAG